MRLSPLLFLLSSPLLSISEALSSQIQYDPASTISHNINDQTNMGKTGKHSLRADGEERTRFMIDSKVAGIVRSLNLSEEQIGLISLHHNSETEMMKWLFAEDYTPGVLKRELGIAELKSRDSDYKKHPDYQFYRRYKRRYFGNDLHNP